MAEWEDSKENFQPLRRGRDPGKLGDVAPSPAVAKRSVEEQRRQWWREIEQDTGPDPLDFWLRFIKWTQANFTSGGHQAELLPLLERCTRELQGREDYKRDPRYLRVWIHYADCLPEPRDVFTFLMENGIGQDFALFYIAYAAFLELRGSFDRAEAVFQAGLTKMAMPVHKLRAKFEDFQERKRRRQRAAEEAGLPAEAPEASREALGVLRSKGRSAGLARPSRLPPQAAAGTAGAVSGRQRSANAENAENADGFEVFVDDAFQPGAASEPADPGIGGSRTGGAWASLGSFEATRKENERQRSKFKGSKLAQNRALMPQPAPFLDIPVDEELQGVEPVQAKPPKGTLRQRMEAAGGPRLEDELLQDPLRLHKDPALAAKQQQQQAQAQAREQRAQPPAAAAAEPAAPPADDVSFEEVRAEHWRATAGRRPAIAEAGRGEVVEAPERRPPSPGAARDVTLDTRAALDSMFRGALPHDAAWCGGGEATATVRLPDPTVTLSTRAAFDVVNSMFGARLPHEAPPPAEEPTGALAVYEDTDFLPGGRPGSGPGGAGGDVYQDTEFLTARLGGRGGGGGAPGGGRERDQTDAFLVYEDTDLLGPHGGGGGAPTIDQENARPG